MAKIFNTQTSSITPTTSKEEILVQIASSASAYIKLLKEGNHEAELLLEQLEDQLEYYQSL